MWASLLSLVVVAGGLGAVYAWSLRRYPKRDCWLCHGQSRDEDSIWRGAFGSHRCWACGGRGFRVRWGVWLFMRDTYEDIKGGGHGRYY